MILYVCSVSKQHFAIFALKFRLRSKLRFGFGFIYFLYYNKLLLHMAKGKSISWESQVEIFSINTHTHTLSVSVSASFSHRAKESIGLCMMWPFTCLATNHMTRQVTMERGPNARTNCQHQQADNINAENMWFLLSFGFPYFWLFHCNFARFQIAVCIWHVSLLVNSMSLSNCLQSTFRIEFNVNTCKVDTRISTSI